MEDQTFRAIVGDQSFDVSIENGTLTFAGEARDVSVDVLRQGYLSLIVDGKSVPVSVEETGDATYRVTIAGRRTEVHVMDERAMLLDEFGLDAAGVGGGEVRAPMPGLVLDVLVEVGDAVSADDGLLVLEAMKMENELSAPASGVVTAIHAATGDAVDKGALLIEIEADA